MFLLFGSSSEEFQIGKKIKGTSAESLAVDCFWNEETPDIGFQFDLGCHLV